MSYPDKEPPMADIPLNNETLPVPAPVEPEDIPEHHGYWELPGESPEFYEKFGVKTFKKFVPTSGDYVRRIFRFNYGGMDQSQPLREQLDGVVLFTKVNEGVHLGLIALFGYTQFTNEPTVKNTVLGVATQLGVNVYPIMVQRYNRLRAYRVQRRLGALATQQTTETEH